MNFFQRKSPSKIGEKYVRKKLQKVAKMPNIRYGWDKENIDTVLSDSFMLVKLCSTQQSTLLEADNPMLMAILSCR